MGKGRVVEWVALGVLCAAPAEAQLALDPLWTVGDTPSTALGRVGDVAFAPDGRVLILDEQAREVRVLDADGTPLGTVGRPGQGPGEIAGAQELEVGPAGELAVLDYRNLRLTLWDAQGTFLRSAPVRELVAGAVYPQELYWRGGILALKATDFGMGEGPVIATVDPVTLQPGRTLARVDSTWSCEFCPFALGPGGMALARGDTLYRLTRLDLDGNLVAPLVREGLPAAPRSPEEIQRMTRTLRARAGAEVEASGGSGAPDPRVSPWQPRLPPGSLEYDDAGRLWVAPTRPDGEQAVVDVFSPAGTLLATLTFPHPVRGVRVAGDRAALLSETPLGEPLVRVYRIRR